MQKPSGAQVLPLPALDASTARGQERGNAALKANENPSQSGSSEEASARAATNDRAWLLAPFAESQGRIERLTDMRQPTIADRESPLTRSKWICRLDLLRSGPPAPRHRGPLPLAWFWQAV
jgi:hypothetical protein